MLTFHFWGSREDAEKGAGLAHPVLAGFGACSCPWLCWDPHSGTAQGWALPDEGPYNAAEMLPELISRRKHKLSRQQPRQPKAEQAVSTRQVYLDSTEKLWCLLIPYLSYFCQY